MACIDASHAKAALAMQLNRTDAKDAVGRTQIVHAGWYREVAAKSEHSHRNRGLLKVFGHVIGAVGGAKFDARVRELTAGNTALTIRAEALLVVRAALAAQVAQLDKLVLTQARQGPAGQRLMAVPGVGAITATAPFVP